MFSLLTDVYVVPYGKKCLRYDVVFSLCLSDLRSLWPILQEKHINYFAAAASVLQGLMDTSTGTGYLIDASSK